MHLSHRNVQARASTGGTGNPPAPPSGGGGGGGGGKGDSGSGSGSNSSGLWSAYLKALEANPLMVKCLTSGILNVAGDAISQVLSWALFMFSSFLMPVCLHVDIGSYPIICRQQKSVARVIIEIPWKEIEKL